MKNDNEIIEALLLGGIIGATLGALASKNEENGAILGALAGATLLATFRANEKALESNLPMYVEENGKLYKIQANGIKEFVREIEKPKIKLQKHFILK